MTKQKQVVKKKWKHLFNHRGHRDFENIEMTDMKKMREGGYLKTTPEQEKEKSGWKLVKKVGLVLGIIVSLFLIYEAISKYVGKDELMKEDKRVKQKIEDIDIEQKGKTLSNVTGVDMSNNPRDTEMGKVKIHQEGESLRNVTGMKMEFDANSGEVELKDKVEIKQQGPHGQNSVTFNADLPGVEITFNKKSEDPNE